MGRQLKNAAAEPPNRYRARHVPPSATNPRVAGGGPPPPASARGDVERDRRVAPNRYACPCRVTMSAWTEEVLSWRDERLGLTELPAPTSRRKQRSAPYRLHRPHLSSAHVPESVAEHGTHISRLYPELLALIFERLPVRDRGRAAQVCRAWRDAADRRSVWRGVEAALHLRKPAPVLFASLARRGVRRLQVLSLRRGLRDAVAALPGLESLSLACIAIDLTF